MAIIMAMKVILSSSECCMAQLIPLVANETGCKPEVNVQNVQPPVNDVEYW